jgi:hypothetical protein
MKKVISNKQDKLVSINGESEDKTWYRYTVRRTRTEVTEWEIETTKKLDKHILVHSALWRENTGGNKAFPYGLTEYRGFDVDVGHGTPLIDHDTTEWTHELEDDNE